MVEFKQYSFSSGELSPAVAARSDQARYVSGLEECSNFITLKSGGVLNRAGSDFVIAARYPDKASRAITFAFNDDQTYMLEVGDQYIRFMKGGDTVDYRNPANLPAGWLTATAYAVGQAVLGTTYFGDLIYVYYCIVAHTSGASTEPDVGADSDDVWYRMSVYASGPWTDSSIYEVPTPYVEADIFALKFVQSGDVITITHRSYAPRELARYGDRSWKLTVVSFSPTITPPQNTLASGSAGTKTHHYVVTAVKAETFEESLPGTAGTGSGPLVVAVSSVAVSGIYFLCTTAAPHGLTDGTIVVPSGFSSTPIGSNATGGHYLVTNYRESLAGINGLRLAAVVTSATTFRLASITTAKYSGTSPVAGSVTVGTSTAGSVADPSASTPITVTWDQVSTAREYNVYRQKNGIYGFVGTTSALSFVDDGIAPDTARTAPVDNVPFVGENFPATTTYFQQRQLFGSTYAQPEKNWLSQIGSFHNLSARSPSQDDDAFSFQINGKKVNEVQSYAEVNGNLIALTSAGIWSIEGGGDAALTPTNVRARLVGNFGASDLRPIDIDNALLFVQSRSPIIRSLKYSLAEGFPSDELSIFSAHLIAGYDIVDWDYAAYPYSVVWAVRNDGALLGLTYVPEQQVVGWHHHHTGVDATDAFESVCVVPEGDLDALYAVVRRTINGGIVRYIERFHTRVVDDVAADATFVDCSRRVRTDGAGDYVNDLLQPFTARTLIIGGGTLWDSTETLTLTVALFAPHLFYAPVTGAPKHRVRFISGSDEVVIEVRDITDPRHATGIVVSATPVPVAIRGVATADWHYQYGSIDGLDHLEGRTVRGLADGNALLDMVVTAGAVVLPKPAENVVIGLPYVSELRTLSPENAQAVLTGKRKRVSRVAIQLEKTRGGKIGPDASRLSPLLRPSGANLAAISLFTGVTEQPIAGDWSTDGRVVIRQEDPLPITVLSIVPSLDVGG